MRSPFGWRGQTKRVSLGLAIVGVEHDDVVAGRVAGEEAEQRARVQVGLLFPHALQARAEVLGEQLLPGLAFDALAAPMELEQDVRVEVRVDLLEIDGDLFHAPERRRRYRRVGAGGRAD